MNSIAPLHLLNGSTSHACEAGLVNSDLLDFPLIAKNNTFDELTSKQARLGNIYFGTGVATPKKLSQGLPFDFLGMLLTSEWIRQKTNSKKIIHEISDSHAHIAHEGSNINGIATQQKELVLKLTKALGLEHTYDCILASEYRHTTAFQETQREVDSLSHENSLPYVRYQSAGNLHFARNENVTYKVGWLVEDDGSKGKLDERSFNAAYDDLGVDQISFAYTWHGWAFDQQRARVSPYTYLKNENRLMLKSQSSSIFEIKNLMNNCPNKKITRLAVLHMARIVTAYNYIFTGQPNDFWSNNPKEESDMFIFSPKQDTWILGKYINVYKLSKQIDTIRSLVSS